MLTTRCAGCKNTESEPSGMRACKCHVPPVSSSTLRFDWARSGTNAAATSNAARLSWESLREVRGEVPGSDMVHQPEAALLLVTLGCGWERGKMLRLLLVTAHPDDEAGGFGGTLLLYRRRGVETFVICLTPGQAARNRGSARSSDELSTMRREEFARACKLLEVSHGEVLDFPDAQLDRTDFYRMVERI